MPRIFFQNREIKVPGAYGAIEVVSTLSGPLPQFHVPTVIGAGFEGHPYDADSKLVTGESPFSPFKRCNTDSAVAAYYGVQSELHRGMRFAKRHGLPAAFVVNLSPMTRFSVVADTVTTNIEQFVLHSRTFGPLAGWRKIQFVGGVLTTTPVKRYAMLSANAGVSATRLYLVGSHPWLSVGASVSVGANSVTNVTRTVTNAGQEVTAAGQIAYWIEISSAHGSALNTSAYAAVAQYDENRKEVTPVFTTGQGMIDWQNEFSAYWRAVRHANFSGVLPADIVTATPAKQVTAWNTVVSGTAPAPTDTDMQAFVALMNGGQWAAFADRENALPNTYLLLTGDSVQHATARDYAAAERLRGYPINVTTGGRWGDVVIAAGDVTDPVFRAAALNSQDVCLTAGGLDREASYLSLAAAVFGRRVAGGPGHNLTNDEIIASHREVEWDEINSSELSALCSAGVVTWKFSTGTAGFRYRVSQGLSTLQANAGAIWNESDATTWALMQRDLADAVLQVLLADQEEWAVGGDRVTAAGIAGIINRRAGSMERAGWVKPGTVGVSSIRLNDAGNGFDVIPQVRLPDTADYITLLLQILVGE